MKFLKANIRYELHRLKIVIRHRLVTPPGALQKVSLTSLNPMRCVCGWAGHEKETKRHRLEHYVCPKCETRWVYYDSYRKRVILALNRIDAYLYPWTTNGRKNTKSEKNNRHE